MKNILTLSDKKLNIYLCIGGNLPSTKLTSTCCGQMVLATASLKWFCRQEMDLRI